jgi:hypothetical protein
MNATISKSALNIHIYIYIEFLDSPLSYSKNRVRAHVKLNVLPNPYDTK